MSERKGFFALFATAALTLALALPAAAAVLPEGFTGKAIGDGGGSVQDAGDKLTIQAEGADINFDRDDFYFVSRELTGDGTLTARLTAARDGAEADLQSQQLGAKYGLMIRADADPDSANAMITGAENNFGIAFRWREEKGGDITHEAGYARNTLPLWFRIQRIGDQVTGYVSSDGQLWTATNTKTVALGGTASIGLAVTSYADDQMMTTEWDNVSFSQGPQQVTGLQACGSEQGVSLTWEAVPGATGYLVFRGAPNIDRNSAKLDQLVRISTDPVPAGTPAYTDLDTALQPGARALYGVAPVLADGTQGALTVVLSGKSGPLVSPLPGFTVTAIGQHQEGDCAQGSVGAWMDAATGVVTLRGGGHDIWNDGDHYVLISKKLTGDGSMTIQPLDFASGINSMGCSCGKGGLIVVERAEARSRFAMASVRPDGLAAQWRDGDGIEGSGEHGSGDALDFDELRAALKAGLLLRVEREGDEVRTLYSLDNGQTFEQIADPVFLEGLANEVEIGVMITMRDRDAPIQNRLGEFQFKIIE